MSAYIAGCICLTSMGAISLWIVLPGLLTAIRFLFPSAPPPSWSADPQPRAEGGSARPTGSTVHG